MSGKVMAGKIHEAVGPSKGCQKSTPITKKRKVYILISLLMGTLLILCGCGASQSTEETGEKKEAVEKAPEKLTIAVLPTEDIIPMVVAQKEGYFTAENLEVELVSFPSPVEESNAMQSGEMDGMMTDLIVASLLKDAGFDLKVTSITLGVTPQEGKFAIVAAPGSKINTPADLKGKKIGISYHSIIEYVTDGLLRENGLDPSDVEKVAIPKIPLRMEMLFSNQIDAIVVPDPLLTFAQFKGAKIIAEDTRENLSQAVLAFTGKALTEKEAALQAFYRAYTQAVRDLNDHPEAYQDLLIENVNIPEPIAQDYALQRYPEPQLPADADVAKIINWMKEKDLLKNDLKAEELVQKAD